MQQISTTVQIAQPIDATFRALTDVENNPHWIKSVSAIELIDDLPVREGFRFRETGGFMWVNMTDEKRVTVYDRPNQFAFTGTFLGNSTNYVLNAVTDQLTDVTLTLSGTAPRGTPLVVQKQVLKQAVKRMTKDLKRLGQLLAGKS